MVGIMISVDPSESALHLVPDDREHMLLLDMHGELGSVGSGCRENLSVLLINVLWKEHPKWFLKSCLWQED